MTPRQASKVLGKLVVGLVQHNNCSGTRLRKMIHVIRRDQVPVGLLGLARNMIRVLRFNGRGNSVQIESVLAHRHLDQLSTRRFGGQAVNDK